MKPKQYPVTRFYTLDMLRAIAALITLVWHYQHFFMSTGGHLPASFSYESLPFYSLLMPLYHFGYMRVDIFFILSGFILYAIYFRSINSRRTSAARFFVLRFSRLYPLHFITLVIVAVLQIISIVLGYGQIVYRNTDVYHFSLQLLMISDWGFERGYSFNGPIWSVSIEVLLYTLFFILSALAPRRRRSVVAWTVAIVIAAHLLGPHLKQNAVAHSILCFFTGVAVYQFFEWCREQSQATRRLVLAVAVCLLTIAVIAMAGWHWLPKRRMMGGALFPILVLALALLQQEMPSLGKQFNGFSNCTYALLLVHFPIQAFIILASLQFGVAIDYTSEWVMLAFVAASIATAVAVHIWFELPVQSYLRSLTAEDVVPNGRKGAAVGRGVPVHGASSMR